MIRVQNLYFMLSYAFRVLETNGYRRLAVEEFSNATELCAEILFLGMNSLLKSGLGRDYQAQYETLSMLRGKVDVSQSLKSGALLRRQLVCEFDEFTVDTPMNQILKATIVALIRSNVSKGTKKKLRKLLVYLAEVSDISLHTVNWQMRFHRNNRTYALLMYVCWLLHDGLLQTPADGSRRMLDFFPQEKMERLFERFLLEYFRKEHPDLSVNGSQIRWTVDDGYSDFLPIMRSDITLSKGDQILIIDAKYYSTILSSRFQKNTYRSEHLYQIFAYVKNVDAALRKENRLGQVAGMLLYAQTDDEPAQSSEYQLSGNVIAVRSLDLNQHFTQIRANLDSIVKDHFEVKFT